MEHRNPYGVVDRPLSLRERVNVPRLPRTSGFSLASPSRRLSAQGEGSAGENRPLIITSLSHPPGGRGFYTAFSGPPCLLPVSSSRSPRPPPLSLFAPR